MSSATKHTLSPVEAARQVAQMLGLDDVKRVGIALATAAVEETERSATFAARVRAHYSAAKPLGSAPRNKKPSATALWSEVKPIKQVQGFDFDPSARVDPYLVYEAYGPSQFARILEAFPLAKLKESAAIVEERQTGTKPVSRSSKSALVEYIVRYVGDDGK